MFIVGILDRLHYDTRLLSFGFRHSPQCDQQCSPQSSNPLGSHFSCIATLPLCFVFVWSFDYISIDYMFLTSKRLSLILDSSIQYMERRQEFGGLYAKIHSGLAQSQCKKHSQKKKLSLVRFKFWLISFRREQNLTADIVRQVSQMQARSHLKSIPMYNTFC